MPETAPHANRLANEPSPYLQQHARNPVDWYPWGEEAFAQARAEDRPIFLSIGYSTCHWCHVMAHESFEDPEAARLINETFVPVKVDREERPDIDQTYMTVCQMMTGSGGWPLTIIATPEGKPFFAATYIPKTSRFGRSGLLELIPKIAGAWKNRRPEVERYAQNLTDVLRRASEGGGDLPAAETGLLPTGGVFPGRQLLDEAFEELRRTFDREHGGFGSRPKFPTPHHLTFLLRYWLRSGRREALDMVEASLRAMRRGGIYDHLGHGFHRYSTDARWHLPHFEKMLYDQAMMVLACAECYQATSDEEYRHTAEDVISYVRRVLTGAGGGFFSAEDADSEGEEGKFYVWEAVEIGEVLGPERAAAFCAAYEVKADGNFLDEATGRRDRRNVLHLARDSDPRGLAREREELFARREGRVHPSKDDKILTDWNGLMIAALGRAAQAFDGQAHARLAAGAAGFILENMAGEGGPLLHRHRHGKTDIRGFLDDYAFFVWGLLELYEATLEPRWLREAVRLNRAMIGRFEDQEGGAFFFTGAGVQQVLTRGKEFQDGAVPSGNSVAILNLLRIARMTGDVSLEETAARASGAARIRAARAPSAFTQLLGAIDFALGPAREVVVVGATGGEDTRAMLRAVTRPFVPNKVVLLREPGPAGAEVAQLAPFTGPLVAVGGEATAYVCRDFQCGLPATDPAEAAEMLQDYLGAEAAASRPAPRSQPTVAGPPGQS